jgi:hypothetical protein
MYRISRRQAATATHLTEVCAAFSPSVELVYFECEEEPCIVGLAVDAGQTMLLEGDIASERYQYLVAAPLTRVGYLDQPGVLLAFLDPRYATHPDYSGARMSSAMAEMLERVAIAKHHGADLFTTARLCE